MNLVDRYLLREWLKMLAIVLGATLGLLLMQALYDDFQDLLEDGATLADLGFYFAIRLPSYLSVVLPLALMSSLLYTLGQMHRNNEITALRAAGAGLFKITRGIWAVGLLLCGVMWYINATVIPWSIEESRSIRETLEFRNESKERSVDRVGMKPGVAFDNREEGRMWFFNRYSQFTRRGYGVTLVEMDEQRRETSRLMAHEAWRDPKKGWVFREGRELKIEAESGEVESTTTFSERVRPEFGEDPALMLIYDAKPQNLSFTELRRLMEFLALAESPKLTAYQVRYYSVLAETLAPLIIIALAIPFAVSGVRVNPVVGVSKSLGLFALYFVLMKASAAAGGHQVISPMWAALIPSLAMLGLGGVLMVRAR